MTYLWMHWLRYAMAVFNHYSGLDDLYRLITGPGLVVLMLHRVRDEPDPFPLSLSKQRLHTMLGWLRRRKLLVSLDEGLQFLAQASTPHVRYALTLDDGYRDNLRLIDEEIAPVQAVVYVATDHIGGESIWAYRITEAVEARTRDHLDLTSLELGQFDLSLEQDRSRLYAELPPRMKLLPAEEMQAELDGLLAQLAPPEDSHPRQMLDWNEVKLLHERGVAIGGHTRKHVLLSQVDDARAREEIIGCHDRLAEELGEAPRHFAYPNGRAEDFSERDIRLVREAGYESAVSTVEGINRADTDRFRLRRYNVHEGRFRTPWGRLSKAVFFSETSGLLSLLRTLRAS